MKVIIGCYPDKLSCEAEHSDTTVVNSRHDRSVMFLATIEHLTTGASYILTSLDCPMMCCECRAHDFSSTDDMIIFWRKESKDVRLVFDDT